MKNKSERIESTKLNQKSGVPTCHKLFEGVSSSMPLLIAKEVPSHWAGAPEIIYLRST
jgi:hypothetical protein